MCPGCGNGDELLPSVHFLVLCVAWSTRVQHTDSDRRAAPACADGRFAHAGGRAAVAWLVAREARGRGRPQTVQPPCTR